MGRTTLIAVLGAAVVGSTGGGLAALHFSSPRPRPAQVAATPAAGPSTASNPALSDAGVTDPAPSDATSAGPEPIPNGSLTPQLTAVLTRFAAWARDHTGAACPDLATLGLAAHDPWGHDLALTCTDQPADQVIGVVSPGPDGVIGTDDDIPSWTLGPSVTGLVRGPRWKSAPAPLATRPPPRRRSPPPPTATRAPATTPDRAPVIAPDRASSAPPDRTPAPATPPKPAPTVDPTGDDIPARRSSR
jgi:hypothetical protein